jgi:hypothetical protein
VSKDELTFAEKVRTIGYLSGGRTRDRVREDRAADGQRRKHVTDELGNTVTQWARNDRQDVLIRAKPVHGSLSDPN